MKPGTIKDQLKLYQELGFEAQTRHLGNPKFYGTVETGDVNSYIHLWAYKDAADRQARREALYQDQDWLSYRTKSTKAGDQVSQINTLLKSASFWIPDT